MDFLGTTVLPARYIRRRELSHPYRLRLHLFEIRDIPKPPAFMQRNPYLTLSLDYDPFTEKRTPVSMGTLNPKWSPPIIFEWAVENPLAKLVVSLRHWDPIFEQATIATTALDLRKFLGVEEKHIEPHYFSVQTGEQMAGCIPMWVTFSHTDAFKQQIVQTVWENQRYSFIHGWAGRPALWDTESVFVNGNITLFSDDFTAVAPKVA